MNVFLCVCCIYCYEIIAHLKTHYYCVVYNLFALIVVFKMNNKIGIPNSEIMYLINYVNRISVRDINIEKTGQPVQLEKSIIIKIDLNRI